jgi:RNA polymerase sigma factor (sigma-70 family)
MPRPKVMRFFDEKQLPPTEPSYFDADQEPQRIQDFLSGAMRKLPNFVRKVIRLRYLGPQDRPSLEEVAARLGVSRETVRRAERRGLSLLATLLGPFLHLNRD